MSAEELARAAWPPAVGKKIAERTRLGMLRGRTLVVEVEDAVWQRQLTSLSVQILRNLDRIIGGGLVEELSFRVGVPRRPPQRVVRLADEADGIADAGMRRIYLQSRRRASI